MRTHSGSCLCGGSRFEFYGDPDFCILCYCNDCQKVTGSGSAPQVAVKVTKTRRSGMLRVYRATSKKGNELEFGFCGECGCPVYKTTEMAPHLVFFYAGLLNQSDVFKNPMKVFDENRPAWEPV